MKIIIIIQSIYTLKLKRLLKHVHIEVKWIRMKWFSFSFQVLMSGWRISFPPAHLHVETRTSDWPAACTNIWLFQLKLYKAQQRHILLIQSIYIFTAGALKSVQFNPEDGESRHEGNKTQQLFLCSIRAWLVRPDYFWNYWTANDKLPSSLLMCDGDEGTSRLVSSSQEDALCPWWTAVCPSPAASSWFTVCKLAESWETNSST